MRWWAAGVIAVFLPMLLEWRRSVRHERQLRAGGAVEPAGDVWPLMSAAYPSCFAALAVEGWVRGTPAAPWLPIGALVFVVAKTLKYWAIATLGERWTFRVLVLPAAPLVRRGPYRWLRHPNYLGVCGELLGAWAWFGAWLAGPMATAAFVALMWRRVRIEDRALHAGSLPRPGTVP